MKRYLGLVLVLALSVQLLTGCSQSDSEAENQQDQQASATGVLATTDLAQYTNCQAFVQYADGSFSVISYEDEDALAAGLKELSADDSVALVQPNYTYDNAALETDDALLGQQWALSNDGSFVMEQQQNDFPVYDEPFDEPSAPGQWVPPQMGSEQRGMPGGGGIRRQSVGSTSVSQSTAVAGIDVNAEDAWEIYDGGSRDVIVALVDTGVDYTHEDLADSIWVNTDEFSGNGVDDDGNGYIDDVYGWNFYANSNEVCLGDEDDHGTHGAGTIAASAENGIGIAGLVQSDKVKLMSVKALGGSDGSGTTASIIQAIEYAEANGASICNLSLGTSQDDRALYQAIANSNMLFVVAAGNDSADTDSKPSYPASYNLDNIISVANLNYDGTLHYSSNYGDTSVDLAAPGSYILSTTTNDSYSYMTGTSMAAPMVTAAAAMVYSYFDTITLADVKEILLSSAQSLDSLKGLTATGGMLDVGAALAFDLTELSGTEWTSPTDTTTGTAGPVVEVEVRSDRGTCYLRVRVTDTDGDLSVTAYAAGTLSAAQFYDGAAGKAFSLNSRGEAVFTVSRGGTYTFYAADAAGNETVKTVTITTGQNRTGYPMNRMTS